MERFAFLGNDSDDDDERQHHATGLGFQYSGLSTESMLSKKDTDNGDGNPGKQGLDRGGKGNDLVDVRVSSESNDSDADSDWDGAECDIPLPDARNHRQRDSIAGDDVRVSPADVRRSHGQQQHRGLHRVRALRPLRQWGDGGEPLWYWTWRLNVQRRLEERVCAFDVCDVIGDAVTRDMTPVSPKLLRQYREVLEDVLDANGVEIQEVIEAHAPCFITTPFRVPEWTCLLHEALDRGSGIVDLYAIDRQVTMQHASKHDAHMDRTGIDCHIELLENDLCGRVLDPKRLTAMRRVLERVLVERRHVLLAKQPDDLLIYQYGVQSMDHTNARSGRTSTWSSALWRALGL